MLGFVQLNRKINSIEPLNI